MKNLYNKDKKSFYMSLLATVVLVVMLIGATYAFFEGDVFGEAPQTVSVTSNTTDLLTFQISDDIVFRVSQAAMSQGGGNVSGQTTATISLTPNNKTNQATMYYYMYLDLSDNPIIYSSTNTNQDPELVLQVYKGQSLVELSGLGSQVTINGVTGYDITDRQGLIPLFDNQAITANGSTKIDTYRVVITFINLPVDQYDNTNKEITGTVILQKTPRLDTDRELPLEMLTVPVQPSGNGGGETPVETRAVGAAETIVHPHFEDIEEETEELYTIYSVGYVDDDSISGVDYTINIQNLGIDFSKYNLELVGTPQVMTTQTDYNNYYEMKNGSLPTVSQLVNEKLNISNVVFIPASQYENEIDMSKMARSNSAVATAVQMYTHSLGTNEMEIDDVTIMCGTTYCTARIQETFSNISSVPKHTTTTYGGRSMSVVYNGVKFSLRKIDKPIVMCEVEPYFPVREYWWDVSPEGYYTTNYTSRIVTIADYDPNYDTFTTIPINGVDFPVLDMRNTSGNCGDDCGFQVHLWYVGRDCYFWIGDGVSTKRQLLSTNMCVYNHATDCDPESVIDNWNNDIFYNYHIN